MITIGQRVQYDPLGHARLAGFTGVHIKATGTVVYVNYPHRWFEAEDKNGFRTSFKFDDIGDRVRII